MMIRVKVKPNSQEQKITQINDHEFVIKIKSPPVDGKAHKELILLLADQFKVKKSDIALRVIVKT